jgi:hypothetical protein
MLPLVIGLVFLIACSSITKSYAKSPSFSLQVIDDSLNDFIDWNSAHPYEKDRSTDISRVTYFSDGKFLNATIWLSCPPNLASHMDAFGLCNENNLVLSVESVPKDTTLENFTNNKERIISAYHTTGLVEFSRDIHLGKYPGHEIAFGSGSEKSLWAWTVNNGKAYTLTYTASPTNFNNFQTIIERIINSLELSSNNHSDTLQEANNSSKEDHYSIYQNTSYGVTLNYPSNWEHKSGHSRNGRTEIVSFYPGSLTSVTYGMYVDADNDNKTGMLGGMDYALNIFKDDIEALWNRQIEQWSDPTTVRFVELNRNYSEFNDIVNPYCLCVDLSLNLDLIGSPDTYKVIFFAIKLNSSDSYDRVGDYTKWALIPPANLAVSMIPNPINMRQGEEDNIQLQLKSNTGFDSQSYIFIPNNPDIEVLNSSLIKFHKINEGFKSPLFKIPALGKISIPLPIKLSESASIIPHSISLNVTSSFPTEFFENNTSDLPLHTGRVLLKIPSTESTPSSQIADMTVMVQSSMNVWEYLSNFFKDWGTVVGIVIGGAASQVWTLVFKRIGKDKTR